MDKRKVASESFLNGCHDTFDDEPVSLKLVRSLAVSSGHAVYTFDNSQEAGERAENQRLDLAFVGLRRWLEKQKARHSLAPHYGSHLYLG